MKLRFPITFILVMLTGTAIAGGIVGVIIWGLFKSGLAEKKVPTWLGVSLMVAAFFTSIYLSNIYEKLEGSLILERI